MRAIPREARVDRHVPHVLLARGAGELRHVPHLGKGGKSSSLASETRVDRHLAHVGLSLGWLASYASLAHVAHLRGLLLLLLIIILRTSFVGRAR